MTLPPSHIISVLGSILINPLTEHGSRDPITMATYVGIDSLRPVHTLALLSTLSTDRVLCNSSVTSITYPETTDQHTRLNTNYITSTLPSRWIHRTWDSTAAYVIAKLDEISIDWASVDCFDRKGPRAGVAWTETTLAITVYTMPDINWALLKIFYEIYVMTEARIEIRLGKVERHEDGMVMSDSFTDQTFLPPGSEVSFNYELGNFAGGTIGGIIELVDCNGTFQKLCALTCRSYLPVPRSSARQNSDSARIPLEQFGAISCTYPSNPSLIKPIREAIDEVKHLKTEIQELEHAWRTHVIHGERHVIRDHFIYTEAKKEEYRKILQSILGVNLSIGTVCAYSGTRIMKNHHLDWALVDLKGDRTRFIKPNVIQGSGSFNQIKMPLTKTDTLKPGTAVYKAKYPGLSVGHVNYTKSYVRYKDGKGGRFIQAIEWAVLPARGCMQFSEPKDCGAWVVDHVHNTVVGVIYAMNTVSGLTYVTPIQEIFDDIAKDTGCTVRLPMGMDVH